jgi:restriction endonuclease Mrr
MANKIKLFFHTHDLNSKHTENKRLAKNKFDSLACLAKNTNIIAKRMLFHELRSMDPLVFEEFILESLLGCGYKIRRNKKYSGDGGIDGFVFVKGNWTPIQCKRYRRHINNKHISDFSDVVIKNDYKYGLFIHTGKTGEKSKLTIENSPVVLISGEFLINLIAGNINFN